MSKKLTKAQRYTAYCIMLADIEIEKHDMVIGRGFCGVFESITGIDICQPHANGFPLFAKLLPELIKKATKSPDDYVYLWNNWRERFAALQQCIIETSNF